MPTTDNKILNGLGLTTLVGLIKRDIPTAVSELTNDVGFIDQTALTPYVPIDSVTPVAQGVTIAMVGGITLCAPSQIQADWETTNTLSLDFIKNKPSISYDSSTEALRLSGF